MKARIHKLLLTNWPHENDTEVQYKGFCCKKYVLCKQILASAQRQNTEGSVWRSQSYFWQPGQTDHLNCQWRGCETLRSATSSPLLKGEGFKQMLSDVSAGDIQDSFLKPCLLSPCCICFLFPYSSHKIHLCFLFTSLHLLPSSVIVKHRTALLLLEVFFKRFLGFYFIWQRMTGTEEKSYHRGQRF